MDRTYRSLVYWLIAAALVGKVAACAEEIPQENFEGPRASWQAGEADVAYRLEAHVRTNAELHGGRASEQIVVSGGQGSFVYFTHAVQASRIVVELVPTLWVKSNRAGIQLMARVVLPHTADPRTGQPVATLIRGTSYGPAGVWQQLRIADTPQLLTRQVRVLRAQLGPQVDARGAYIDALLLNVYGGPGQTVVFIDDLELPGSVPVQGAEVAPGTHIDPNVQPAAATNARQQAVRKVSLSGSLLQVEGKPVFPRIVEYQGEPLEFLKDLGFSAVRSSQSATAEMLTEASRLGMWIIAPPPREVARASANNGQPNFFNAALYEPILAWHLGSGLATRELEPTIIAAKQLRAWDRTLTRPLVCAAEEELRGYSRHADLLSASRAPLGSSLPLADYGAWLRERPRLARPGTPLWTTVQTEPGELLVRQVAALAGPQAPRPAVDADALRLLVYEAVAAGARGIEFASSSRLDAGDNATRLRAHSLAQLNLELELIEAWGAAGSFVTSATCNDATVRGVVLHTDSARLVMALRVAADSQYVAAPNAGGVSLVVPGVPDSHNVYELSPGGLRPLRHKRIAGGTSVAIEDLPLTALVLITPDALVLQAMTRRAAQTAPRAARLQRELAAAQLVELESLDRRLPRQLAATNELPPLANSLATARTAIVRADELLAAGDAGRAFIAARNAGTALGSWKREAWLRGGKLLGPPPTSPLASSVTTLPEQLTFAAAMQTAAEQPPSENWLSGGDFENLPAMLQAGWRHFQHSQPEVQTAVELSPQAPFADRFCLHMTVGPTDAAAPPPLVETPPLWVTSAPVRVEAGQLVCIRGQVRVSGPVSGSVDGLLVLDSLGGESLAQRFDATSGWKSFTFYRAAPHSGEVTVTFALTGLGEAWIDDVSIRPVRR